MILCCCCFTVEKGRQRGSSRPCCAHERDAGIDKPPPAAAFIDVDPSGVSLHRSSASRVMIGAVHKREPSFLLLLMLMMMLMLLLLANITESHSDTTYSSSVPHKCLAGCRKSGPVLPCSRKHGGWGEKGACIHAWPCHAIVLHLFPHQQKIVPARVSPGIFAACEARCGGSVAPSRTSSWQQQQQKTLACARRLWAAQHVQCGLFCTAPLAGASRMPGTVHQVQRIIVSVWLAALPVSLPSLPFPPHDVVGSQTREREKAPTLA